MLCLVADEDEERTERVGQVVGRRLRAAARALRLTQGQVFVKCNEGALPGAEIISEATVSAVMGGRVNNPGIGTVLIIARALGLTTDQVLGISPMPETVPEPAKDDVREQLDDLSARYAMVDARMKRVDDRMDRFATTLDALLARLELRSGELGREMPAGSGKKPRPRDVDSGESRGGTEK